MSSLALLLLLCLATLCLADFDEDNIQDDYSLRAGNKHVCADRLRLEGDELSIVAKDVELNGEECEGDGQIKLQKDSASGNVVTAFFKAQADKVGSFLAGPVSDNLSCGTASIARDTVVVLVRPDEDLDDVKWTEIFGGDSPIGDNADDDDWDFDEDNKYVFLGDQCFYAQTNLGDRAECFPGDATVMLESGARKRMDEVRVGDRVLVGAGKYSDVFGWTHKSAGSSGWYVGIETEAGQRLVATGGHYVYADDVAMQMKQVRKGMRMRGGDGAETRVAKVEKVRGKGLYNPQTVHGDIVVDGVVATSYTAAVEPGAAHALLAPVRAVYKAVRAAMLPVKGKGEL